MSSMVHIMARSCFRPRLVKGPGAHAWNLALAALPAIDQFLGNRFIPRPDELVSYGVGLFDADRPYRLMWPSRARPVYSMPLCSMERQFLDNGKRPGQCGESGLWPGSTSNRHGDTNLHGGIQTRAHAEGESV
jgi:hypothetical protein